MSTCEAARVGVFVVDPDVEPQFFPLFHTVFIKVEPFVGVVFGDQPRPRVDEGAAEALRLEVAQHPVDVGAGDPRVPDPQGRRAECPRGIGEFLSELLEFHFPFLGGCGVAGEARCRQGGRQQAFDCGGFGFHGRSGLCLLYKGKGYALRAVTNPDKRLFISDKACGGWRGRTERFGAGCGAGRDGMAGMLPGRAGGIVRNGGLWNRGIRGPGIRQNGGGAESRRKKHGEPGRVPSHGRHGGCGRGYLRGRMATMRVPPVYPESMYISPCRWVTIRRQR